MVNSVLLAISALSASSTTTCEGLSAPVVMDLTHVFLSGLLSGSLFVIHYAVRPVLSSLEERPQIGTRQAFILRLRLLIPLLFVPTVVTAAASALTGWGQAGSPFRITGAVMSALSFLTTLAGTAPINKAVLSWQAGSPPTSWRPQIARWERLDGPRTWATLASLTLMIAALGARLEAC